MIGIYFSGTGNTKYCLEKFVALYDRNIEITPLEDTGTMEKVTYHKDIIFAYPIYYSNLPKIVRDFICENSDIWKGKRVFIIATMGLFSGDGAGVGVAGGHGVVADHGGGGVSRFRRSGIACVPRQNEPQCGDVRRTRAPVHLFHLRHAHVRECGVRARRAGVRMPVARGRDH